MPRTTKAVIAGRDGGTAVEGEHGVLAVERAARILRAFHAGEPYLGLAALSERAQLHKTTALRIARTLAGAGFLVQGADGSWRLGPAAGWLGAQYQQTFDVNDAVTPLLRELARETGESASLFVREGDVRTCLLRVESASEERPAVHPGTSFPLAKGAPGRVILAFSGQPGALYEEIRRRGYHLAIRERAAEAASVAAPVFGTNWQLLGAVSVSGPASRLSEARLRSCAGAVVTTARRASQLLGGTYVQSLARRRP
ncbi:IclR family transcriptional regulator [Ramlibacter sp. USB13]|uniref:IclR family transcriptional regulator n=1 Tax=Ramlibacter cellulosilyticus TaxID=2764187 RepID=A0A923MNP3_9BURK|nr:IclR family transcriptional regulator [Ramlibacter cellulosilyticus]MBC5781414.1 IclR family transcriptional regulator [Ramlibacter cellulosilyticus]